MRCGRHTGVDAVFINERFICGTDLEAIDSKS
jgi:hypothetical protein